MAEISDAAKGVASLFGLGGNKFILSFKMVESRPSDPCKAALDELVAAGIIMSEPQHGGGIKYKALVDCGKYRRFATRAKFPIVVPIGS